MIASDEEIRKIREEREAKDPRYKLDADWDSSSILKGMRNRIEDRGYFQCKDARVYTAKLASFLCSDSVTVMRLSDEQLVQVSGFSYLTSYLSGYQRGRKEFEEVHKVSPDTLYGSRAQDYLTNLHNLYYHSEEVHSGVAEGWHYWKTHFNMIISHANIEREGYYAGLMSCVDELSEKHPALFREFHSCKIQLEPISSPNTTQMNLIQQADKIYNIGKIDEANFS